VGQVVGIDERGSGPPLQLVGREAQDVVGRGAGVADDVRGVEHGDHIGGVLGQRAEALLAAVWRLLWRRIVHIQSFILLLSFAILLRVSV